MADSDTTHSDMTYEEKVAWAGLIVSIIHFTVYLSVLLSRAAVTPMPETPYVDAMLWSIGAGIVVMIVVSIVVAVMWPPAWRAQSTQTGPPTGSASR